MQIGELVKQIRERRLNLTQEKLGVRLGVYRETVANWELGKQTPERKYLDLLLGYLGLTWEDCIELPPDPRSANEEESVLSPIAKLFRHDPGGRAIVVGWSMTAENYLQGQRMSRRSPRKTKKKRNGKESK